MKVYYTDIFELPLPTGHRFPMAKYRLLRERIEQSSIREHIKLLVPHATTDEELQLVHTAEYISRLLDGKLSDVEERRIGFPWSEKMIERSRRSTGASIDAGFSALKDKVSVNLAGGTHHAFPDSGQGYCVFNDVCVAARVLRNGGRIQRALLIDCDVHQGNGSAAICKDDDSIFTLSVHCEKNFPFRKTDGDLDVGLPIGTSDDEYLAALNKCLDQTFSQFQPDIAFYVSGADPYIGDRLGQLSLSKSGLAERDRIVFQRCRDLQLPIVVTMAGGYSPDINDIVDIHFQTVSLALEHFKVACKSAPMPLGNTLNEIQI